MSEPSIPKLAIAKPGEITTLGGNWKFLPIVIVPGIMGTRLSKNIYDKTAPARVIDQKLVWNPLGMPLATLPAVPHLPPIPIPPIIAPIPAIGVVGGLGHVAVAISHIAGSYKAQAI